MAEIRHYCNVMLNVINERDWKFQSPEAADFKTQHISPDFQSKIDGNPWAQTFDQQVSFWRQLTLDYPEVHFVLDGVDCNVSKSHRTADVLMRTTMSRGDVRLITACMMQWKFTQGRWQWYCHNGVRGISCESV